MADIQYATAENRRGKKRKKKPHHENIMACIRGKSPRKCIYRAAIKIN